MSARRSLAVGAAVSAALLLALRATADAPPDEARALASFGEIVRVLKSPRCVNCHPAGDAPLNGDQGAPHRMNVKRRSADAGLACATCHRDKNADAPHGPPGVPGWRMPPAETPMTFEGKSAREICEALRDPARNGRKSVADLEEHFAKDPLVLWGFRPGPGRTTPPISHDALVGHVKTWIAAGAPCPR